jgi:hypothetical protein
VLLQAKKMAVTERSLKFAGKWEYLPDLRDLNRICVSRHDTIIHRKGDR